MGRRQPTRELAAALHFLVQVLRTALGVLRELHADEITEARVIAAVDERVTVSEGLPAVPHVDDDVASRREFREQTSGRVGQREDFGRGAHLPDLSDPRAHDLALVQSQLLVGYGGQFLCRGCLLDDAIFRRGRCGLRRPPFEGYRQLIEPPAHLPGKLRRALRAKDATRLNHSSNATRASRRASGWPMH